MTNQMLILKPHHASRLRFPQRLHSPKGGNAKNRVPTRDAFGPCCGYGHKTPLCPVSVHKGLKANRLRDNSHHRSMRAKATGLHLCSVVVTPVIHCPGIRGLTHYSHSKFLYSRGVLPVFCLKSRLKYCGYSKPKSWAISLMFLAENNR